MQHQQALLVIAKKQNEKHRTRHVTDKLVITRVQMRRRTAHCIAGLIDCRYRPCCSLSGPNSLASPRVIFATGEQSSAAHLRLSALAITLIVAKPTTWTALVPAARKKLALISISICRWFIRSCSQDSSLSMYDCWTD